MVIRFTIPSTSLVVGGRINYIRDKIPSMTYCTDSPANIIAMTLEKTFVTFLLINFSDFETMRKRISVIVITLIKEATPIN